MTDSKKVLIIGHFGGKEQLLDGQTVKTVTLYKELSETTDWCIRIVDTYYKRKRPIKLLLQSIYGLITTRDVIVTTSQNGRRVYFPLLYFFVKVFHTRVYHDVIGGRLAKFVVEYPAFKTYLNSFQVNWVETSKVKGDLEAVGITNAELLPNFKRLKIARACGMNRMPDKPYRLCTFSRVLREKGIEDAVRAVWAVNEQLGRTAYALDIYGPVDEGQRNWFEELKNSFPDYVCYRGAVHFESSVDTLKDYFALLFPTRYYTEGVPGTIIDAYAAGVPVIASRWESFSDVVDEGITGYGYGFEDVNALIEMLLQIEDKPERITGLTGNCIKKAEQYLPEKSVAVIVKTITAASEKCNLS